jgi:hypothetical protein
MLARVAVVISRGWEPLWSSATVPDQVAARSTVCLNKPGRDRFALRAEFNEGKSVLNGISGNMPTGQLSGSER